MAERNGLDEWVSGVTGARGISVEPLGVTREMWGVAGTCADGSPLSAVLKRENGRGPFFGTRFTLAREAQVLQLVSDVIPAPKVFAIAEDGEMFLMERLRGTAAWSFDDSGQERRTVRHFLSILATLHEAELAALRLPIPVRESARHQLLANIEDYETAYRSYCPERFAINEALCWVKSHAPADLQISLLHGDAGPGNFMHEDGVVTGLIDWKLSHLGDPMDDLARLWLRKKVLRQDDDLLEWFSIYEEISGRAIDLGKVTFFLRVVLLRTSIAALLAQVRNPGPAAMANHSCRMLAAALREQAGESVATSELPTLC